MPCPAASEKGNRFNLNRYNDSPIRLVTDFCSDLFTNFNRLLSSFSRPLFMTAFIKKGQANYTIAQPG